MHKRTKQRKRNHLSSSNSAIRVASIVQKSITRGRSTFVEMRTISDLVYYNINPKIDSLRFRINNTEYLILRSILHAFLRGYEHILSSNVSMTGCTRKTTGHRLRYCSAPRYNRD